MINIDETGRIVFTTLDETRRIRFGILTEVGRRVIAPVGSSNLLPLLGVGM